MTDIEEIRQRLLFTESQIAKLWTALREATSVIWGDDVKRDNGLRSVVNTLKQVSAELEDELGNIRGELRHYLDAEREASCYGLAALGEMQARQEQEEREEVPVKVATIQAAASGKTQTLILIGVLITGALNLVGIVLSIILQGGGK